MSQAAAGAVSVIPGDGYALRQDAAFGARFDGSGFQNTNNSDCNGKCAAAAFPPFGGDGEQDYD